MSAVLVALVAGKTVRVSRLETLLIRSLQTSYILFGEGYGGINSRLSQIFGADYFDALADELWTPKSEMTYKSLATTEEGFAREDDMSMMLPSDRLLLC